MGNHGDYWHLLEANWTFVSGTLKIIYFLLLVEQSSSFILTWIVFWSGTHCCWFCCVVDLESWVSWFFSRERIQKNYGLEGSPSSLSKAAKWNTTATNNQSLFLSFDTGTKLGRAQLSKPKSGDQNRCPVPLCRYHLDGQNNFLFSVKACLKQSQYGHTP